MEDYVKLQRDAAERTKFDAAMSFAPSVSGRGEYVIDVNVFIADVNSHPCVYGTAVTTYEFQDGTVKVNYYELQYQKTWRLSPANGQVMLSKKAIDSLASYLNRRC